MGAAILFEQRTFWLAKIMSTNQRAAGKRSSVLAEVRMNHAQKVKIRDGDRAVKNKSQYF